MLLKSCNRCGVLIPYGSTYCPTCAPIVAETRDARRREASLRSNRKYNKTRDPKYIRFYNSSDWKILSHKRLQDDGYKCVLCGAIASEVDHIIPIQTPEGWELRLDYNNTRSLCLDCHNKKHKRFLKKKDKRPEVRRSIDVFSASYGRFLYWICILSSVLVKRRESSRTMCKPVGVG